MIISGATSSPTRFANVRTYLKVLGVRVSAAALLILFSASRGILSNQNRIIGLYLAATLVLAIASRHAIEQRFLRLIANVIDVVGISMLIALMARTHWAWLVLLYVFPITAVSRYLGLKWSVPFSVLAVFGYGLGTASRPLALVDALGLAAVLLILVGVAVNAAKLARSRERFESRINTTIDEIYEQLLVNEPLGKVMDSILRAALKLTRSDMAAIILAGKDSGSEFFVATSPQTGAVDPDEAKGILERHYDAVLRTAPRPLSLLKYPSLAKLLGKNAAAEPPWAGRLIAITIGPRAFGVLGLFSRRSVHYTNEDLDKVSGLRPLIALAQQSAFLSQELAARNRKSNDRLQLLYQIGKQLQENEGSATVFQNVVALVSEYVGSEEAALFIPDDRGPLLKKVAVAGPDPTITDGLRLIELTEEPKSLTGRVFYDKVPLVENYIPQSEPHVPEYSDKLPSGITKHYMGVPVLIGVGSAVSDRPLGVIRVLNKRASHYDLASGVANLDPTGFVKDDLELLTAIATYIAGAMRNAMFIEKSRHFEGLIYKSPDPIIVIDRDGYVQNFNRECEKIWKILEKHAIGRHVAEFYESPEHAREIGQALKDAPDHAIYSRDARVRDSEGQVIPIRISANLLFDNEGNRVGSIGVFKDARGMIRAEEKRLLEEKLAAIGRIAQTTGHDLKHDIGAILGFVDTLKDGELSESDKDDVHSGIQTAANEALNKLQNMLMTARTQPRLPDPQIVGVGSLMRDFEASVRFRATLGEVDFIVNPAHEETAIRVEPEQMRQVFANLFGNSMHAVAVATARDRRRGRITFSAAVDQQTVKLTWCDNGDGFTEGTRAQLFTPFFTTKPAGSGLGLYITRRIVENHGGTITIATSSNDGTCFEIVLPLDREQNDPHSGEPTT